MRRYTNPYIAGNPVGKSEVFVGREDVLREVLRVLRDPHRNAITLYGQRRIGKTSVLQWLEAHLPEHGPYVPVYFDLQDRAAKPLSQVLIELADTIVLKLNLPRPQLGTNPETAFHTTWLPQALEHLPQGHSLVLLLDEFDVLADPKQGQAAAEFFPYLRKLLEQDLERLQFVFVLGRNIRDLSQIALSLFKGVPAKRVSLLSREDTEDLVRLAERNGSLRWPEASVARVWEMTHGHPFLTQALCWEVWQRLHEDSPAEPPEVQPDAVDAAIEPTLEHSRNTLEWLWQGLGPAEKVVAAALAHAGPGPVTEEELVRILQESGVRLIIRELEDAPRLLQEWDIIEPVDGGYRFRVELLRRWIADRYTPQSVQKELDRIEPAAENLYQAGRNLYEAGDLEGSRRFLEQALGLNPNHQRAAELLSAIYLSQGDLDKAQELLERLQEYFPHMARPRLVQIYLERAEKAEETEEKRQWYERVLAISPDHRAAREGLCRLLVQDLEALEAVQQYEQALAQAEAFQERHGHCDLLQDILKRLTQKARLKTMYQHALDAVERGDREEALKLLKQIVQIEPQYKETTRYLHWVVTGEDIVKLKRKLKNVNDAYKDIQRKWRKSNVNYKKVVEDLKMARNDKKALENRYQNLYREKEQISHELEDCRQLYAEEKEILENKYREFLIEKERISRELEDCQRLYMKEKEILEKEKEVHQETLRAVQEKRKEYTQLDEEYQLSDKQKGFVPSRGKGGNLRGLTPGLFAILAWLPLLWLTLGASLGTLPLIQNTSLLSQIYLWVSAALMLIALFISWLQQQKLIASSTTLIIQLFIAIIIPIIVAINLRGLTVFCMSIVVWVAITIFNVKEISAIQKTRDRPSLWSLSLLLLSHAFLIWFSLLGGAQVLNQWFG